jgi:hypothetical protein
MDWFIPKKLEGWISHFWDENTFSPERKTFFFEKIRKGKLKQLVIWKRGRYYRASSHDTFTKCKLYKPAGLHLYGFATCTCCYSSAGAGAGPSLGLLMLLSVCVCLSSKKFVHLTCSLFSLTHLLTRRVLFIQLIN